MTYEESKAVVHIVLKAIKTQVNMPEMESTYGDRGLCRMVENYLYKCVRADEGECLKVFKDYLDIWAHENNPNWTEHADIYVVPGQPGGGLNKLAYYEARKEYKLWSKDTEYGRKRHQLLDDLIEATKEASHVQSED